MIQKSVPYLNIVLMFALSFRLCLLLPHSIRCNFLLKAGTTHWIIGAKEIGFGVRFYVDRSGSWALFGACSSCLALSAKAANSSSIPVCLFPVVFGHLSKILLK